MAPNPVARILVDTVLPFDSLLRRPEAGTPRELFLMLHGFAETGERLLSKLEPAIPQALLESAVLLAPNAPFPMPHKTDAGYQATFSWYFYDPQRQAYFIDMEPALRFLESGLRAHGLLELPKRIIGFSQGGYLAAFAASRLPQVHQVIGIGCEYEPESVPCRVDAIHGERDESVDPQGARESHDRLRSRGVPGEFRMLDGVGHRIDDRVRQAFSEALSRIESA